MVETKKNEKKFTIKFILALALIFFFACPFMITKVNAAGPTYEFEYSGDYQTFVVPRSGIYKLETWGAQGGDRGANNGGKGGYTTGEVYLKRGDILYICRWFRKNTWRI